MEKQRAKNYEWVVSIAMLIASIALIYFTFMYNLPHKFEYIRQKDKAVDVQKSIYTSLATYNTDSEYPYIATELPGIYYVAKPNADVEFFNFNGKDFSAVKNVKKIELTLNFSGQKIPVKISYIKSDGKTLGLGTYVRELNSEAYKYAFFKLCDMPSDYNSDADLLLLADFDSQDIFKMEKTYSEAFSLNSKTMKATNAISIKGRTISVLTGAMRDDFAVFDDCSLGSLTDSLLYLSSRSYKLSQGIYGTDIYCQNEYTHSPEVVASDVLDGFLWQTDDGIIYLKDTSKEDSQSFALMIKDGREKTLKTFNGRLYDGFIRHGKYLFDNGTMTLYNLADNTESVLLNISMHNISAFAVSPDGKRIVLAGSLENGRHKLIFYDLYVKRYKSIEQREIFFDDYPNLCFTDNDTVSYIKPAGSPEMTVGNFIVSWSRVFSTLP